MDAQRLPAPVRGGARARPRARRAHRLVAALVAASLVAACQTVEEYLPALVIAGGAAASVLALNHYDDPNYAVAAVSVVTTLTPLAYGAAGSYIDLRRRQREMAELQAIEAEIRAEYARTQAEAGAPAPAGAPAVATTSAPAGPPQWGAASDGAPGEGAPSWGTVDDAPSPAVATLAPGGAPALPAPGGAPGSAPASAPGAGAAAGASPWGDLYPKPGVVARGVDAPLALDVAVARRTAGGLEALADGAVVYDGVGDGEAADALRVFARPSADAYVYVIAIDSVGRVQALHPTSLPAAPVPAGATLSLPGAAHWYGLDRHAGLEHVYFYASTERSAELEASLTPLVGRPLPRVEGRVHTVSERTVLETPAVAARGLTGATAAEPALDAGGDARVALARHVEVAAGNGVAATRVLDHR